MIMGTWTESTAMVAVRQAAKDLFLVTDCISETNAFFCEPERLEWDYFGRQATSLPPKLTRILYFGVPSTSISYRYATFSYLIDVLQVSWRANALGQIREGIWHSVGR